MKDVSDWLAAGHTVEELLALTNAGAVITDSVPTDSNARGWAAAESAPAFLCAPTAEVELAGARDATPKTLDGISFAPTLLGRPERQKQHDYLYWEFHERGFTQAVRMGDWKAVRLGTKKPVELYDLKNDLGEQHDVAALHPEVVAKVEAILKSARTDSQYFPIREGGLKKPGTKKK